MSESVVLDTSAVLSLVEDEAGAAIVEHHLRAAQRGAQTVLLSFMTLMEVRYVITQERDEAAADHVLGLMKCWPVQWVYPDELQCLMAARLKAAHRMSVADAFVAAAAIQHGALLVHKDPEFDHLDQTVSVERLPYK